MKERVKLLLAALGRVLPRTTKLRLARRSTALGHLLLEDGDVEIDDYLGSLRVRVNARNVIERLMLTGDYEPGVAAVVRRRVRSGDTCVDVGANVGPVALLLCQRAAPSGRVFCFEPGHAYAERLRANLALNPELAGVAEVLELGISDQKGELHWKEDAEHPGNAWLLSPDGVPVPVTTLDDFVAERGVDRLDFLKIDTEGMELEVLTGARRCLARFHPVGLFESLMEFEAARGAPIRERTQKLLLDLDYRLYAFDRKGRLTATAYPRFPANTLALWEPAGASPAGDG